MNWPGYEEPDWLGLKWSDWISLDPDQEELAEIPTDEGLYRIRHQTRNGLEYIGETGRSVRGRVRALARGAFADEMPFRDPHVGAPCMWAIRQENGDAFEVAYTTPKGAEDKATRKSMEAALIASYRRAEGESPTGAFSRIIPGYSMSSYSRDDERGRPLKDGETEPYSKSGIPPLEWQSYENPVVSDWMGLNWSEPKSLYEVSADIPASDGVYRIWDPVAPKPLEYIGESANLRSRLRTHGRERDDALHYTYAAPSYIDAKHERLEAETDLIGAHWLAVGEPPIDQH